MSDGREELLILEGGSVTSECYCNEVILPLIRLSRGAIDLEFLFMDYNAIPFRIVTVAECRKVKIVPQNTRGALRGDAL